ncbi:hypothetical protein HPB48_020901 [Haemaphysalis longicornis]|uniref:Partial AB-hydrolase lipase domain-containing protein n=1 Tax=Haemaphysalis longicornis TaxID=44386 RepID=A0A9J6H0W3_HAELO|nr:hypothetical protein HPB48_020901 [Haemaphysalis longicornis]
MPTVELIELWSRDLTARPPVPSQSLPCGPQESLITSKGYLFERHSVVTDDGYVIEMHRIPYGREPCSEPCRTQPILLMSPLLTDSTVYVLDSPEQSLGERKFWLIFSPCVL